MTDEIYRAWRRVAAIEETAESGDGCVTATVGARGELRALRLDPRLYRAADAELLANDILETVAAAAELASRRAFDAVAPLLDRNATIEDADPAFDPILHNLAEGKGS